MKVNALLLVSVFAFLYIVMSAVHAQTYPLCTSICQYSFCSGTCTGPGTFYAPANEYYSTSSPGGYYCYASSSGGQGSVCSYPLQTPIIATANTSIDSGINEVMNLTWSGGVYLMGSNNLHSNLYNVTSGKVIPSCVNSPNTFCYNSLATTGAGVNERWFFSFKTSETVPTVLSFNGVITDATGTTLSSATNSITVYPPLTVSVSPSSYTVTGGQPIMLTATGSGGDPPYSYHWYSGSSTMYCTAEIQIQGATAQTLLYYPTSSSNYCATVTDSDSPEVRYLRSSNIVPVTISSTTPPISVSIAPQGTFAMLPGNTLTLSALATGGVSPYTYNFVISNSITGAVVESKLSSSNTFTFTATSNLEGDTLYANVTAADSESPSAIAETEAYEIYIAVNPPLSVALSPSTTQTIPAGQSVTFTANVVGCSPSAGCTPYYIWYAGSSSTCTSDTYISQGTSSSYIATPTSPTYYCVEVIDYQQPEQIVYSSTVEVIPSGSAPLAASISPSSTQPIITGQSVTFTGTGSGGSAPYTSKWYSGSSSTCSSDTLISGTSSSGATSAYIATPSTSTYYCVAYTDSENPAKTVYSSTTEVVPSPQLVVLISPSSTQTINSGQSVIFTSSASGGTPQYSAQWYSGPSSTCTFDSPISGATSTGASSTYTATSATSGIYYCVIYTDSGNPAQVIASQAVNVIFASPPLSASISPSTTQTINSGQSVTFTASASGGTSPYTYQWYSGTNPTCSSDTPISGQTSVTYIASPTSAEYYCFEVKDSGSPQQQAYSSAVEVTITAPALTVKIKPNKVILRVGKSVTIKSVVSGGVPPYTYSWSEETAPSTTYLPITSTKCVAKCPITDPPVGTYYIELTVTDSKGNTGMSKSTKITVLSKSAAAPTADVNNETDSSGNVTDINVGSPIVTSTSQSIQEQIPNNTSQNTTIIQQSTQSQSIWSEIVSFFQRLF